MNDEREKSGFWEKAASFIVDNYKLFMLLFAAVMVFSLFSSSWVQVEEDITTYLPESAEAKQGLAIMEQEFTNFTSARIMVENISLPEAKDLAERLRGIDGVLQLSFEDNVTSYRDYKALFEVTFEGENLDALSVSAMEQIKEELSSHSAYIYSEVGSSLSDIIAQEMLGVVGLVSVVVIAVLIFVTSTYGEVLVLLGAFLCAALINMGTNFLMGTISFVSDSIAIVMQLALSVDYALIFCNRYKEKHELLPKKEAIKKALALSIPEISASSLTTVAGLAAMTFMEFKLGADMGFVLIKAVLLSLVSVFLFMPGLLMVFGDLMDRTKHKNFVPKISFAGRFAFATRHIITPLFICLFIAAYICFGKCQYAYDMSIVPASKQNEQDIALARIEETFGESSNIMAVLVPAGNYDKEEAFLNELSELDEVESVLGLASIDALKGYKLSDSVNCGEFASLAQVDELTAQALFAYYAAEHGQHQQVLESLESYSAPLLDMFLFLHDAADSGTVPIEQEQLDLINSLYSQLDMAQKQLQGENYSRMLLFTGLPIQSVETYDFIDKVHVLAEKYYPEGICMTGNSVSAYGFHESFEKDNMIVGLVSVALVMVILLFTFKSVGLPLLLILVIQGSIWINFAIPVLAGQYVFFMCYLIVSSIQMGANIDYAIVLSSRYLEMRKKYDRREAMIKALNLSFPTVITSGTMTVLSGILIDKMVSQCVISGTGHYIGTGAMITVILVNFALPQILLFGDGLILRTRFILNSPGVLHLSLRRALAALLAAAGIFAIVAAPYGWIHADDKKNDVISDNEDLIQLSRELAQLAESLGLDTEATAPSMDFAEELLTDKVGQQKLEESEVLLEEGRQQLEEGQAKYDAGAGQLYYAQQQYNDGLAQYEAGVQELAKAKEEYENGKALMVQIEPLYNAVMPRYQEYTALQSRYDAAIAEGDAETAAQLKPALDAARIAFDTQLGSTGYSVSGLLQAYQDAEAALSSAEQQIADAEQQLKDAEKQLDDGKKQLAQSQGQLSNAYSQLQAGYEELEAGEQQLEGGRQQLEENRQLLEESTALLDKFEQEKQRFEKGLSRLNEHESIAALDYCSYEELFSQAEDILESEADSADDRADWSLMVFIVLLLAGFLALVSVLLWFALSGPLAAICAAMMSAVCALLAALFWLIFCSALGLLPFAAGLCLFIAASLCAGAMVHFGHRIASLV